MARILEFGFGGICEDTERHEDVVDKIDIHDQKVPLIDRVVVASLLLGNVCCNDFLCTKDELTKVLKELGHPDYI